MIRRLRIYLFGFGLGLIMVYLFFGRDDSRDLDIWTPEQRILEAIRQDSVFMESEKLHCFQSCLNMDDSLVLALFTNSENKSLNPGGNPYRYWINLETDDLHYEAIVEKDSLQKHKLVYIKNLDQQTNCACD